MGKHRSRPYNPLIANTFFRAGFIEAWGRGIEKIKDSCKEAGNPMPEYTIKREEIMVMFKNLVSNTDQATNQANQDDNNSVIVRILQVIEAEPRLSQKKIANVIGEKVKVKSSAPRQIQRRLLAALVIALSRKVF